MPGAKESSTVEWHSAHSMPTERRLPSEAKNPFTPTTELSFSRASVTAGSSRSTFPAASASRTAAGSALTSTLSPTESAVFGLTPGPTPPLGCPGDRPVKVQRAAPELLVAERVEPEGLASLAHEVLGVLIDGLVRLRRGVVPLAAPVVAAVAWKPSATMPPSNKVPRVMASCDGLGARRAGRCATAPGGSVFSSGFAMVASIL